MALKKNSLVTATATDKKGANGVKKVASKRGAKVEEKTRPPRFQTRNLKSLLRRFLLRARRNQTPKKKNIPQNENGSESEVSMRS